MMTVLLFYTLGKADFDAVLQEGAAEDTRPPGQKDGRMEKNQGTGFAVHYAFKISWELMISTP